MLCLCLYAQESGDLSHEYLAKSAAPVNAVAWTRDGKYFVTGWNNSVILWNAETNTIAGLYSNSVNESSSPLANVTSLQFSSDGQYMLSVRDDNTVLVHSVSTFSNSTLISGTGGSIPDAVYADDYKIILPLDGKNLYESAWIPDSAQYIVEEKLDFSGGVWALSASRDGRRILATDRSGAVRLIDTGSWDVIAEFRRYTLSDIKPRFAPDGVHFLAARNDRTLVVSSVVNNFDNFTLEDGAGFSFAAEFSSDCSKVVAGLNSGLVKIYDIASGVEENSFALMAGDRAKSLAFSPDDKYVVIGTEYGYIYLWGFEERKPPKSHAPGAAGDGAAVAEKERDLENALVLSLGYGGLNSDYYLGDYSFNAGYRSYSRRPFSWGANFSIAAGVPGSKFPYTYHEGNEPLGSPFVYTVSAGGVLGLVRYNKERDFHVFGEAGAGVNSRILFNNNLKYPHTSKAYFGFYAEILAGAQWKWARFAGGIQYDSNIHFLGKAQLGVAIPVGTFKKK